MIKIEDFDTTDPGHSHRKKLVLSRETLTVSCITMPFPHSCLEEQEGKLINLGWLPRYDGNYNAYYTARLEQPHVQIALEAVAESGPSNPQWEEVEYAMYSAQRDIENMNYCCYSDS